MLLWVGALADPAALSACRRPAYSREYIERSYVNDFTEADAVVEVQGTADMTAASGGAARVLRVFKGDRRVGEVIQLPATPLTTCNRPWLRVGNRGILFLRGDRLQSAGFASEDELRFLRRHGLLPAD